MPVLAGCEREIAERHRKWAEAASAQQLPSPCHWPRSSSTDRLPRTLQLGPSTLQDPPNAPLATVAGLAPSSLARTMAWHSTECSSSLEEGKEPGKTRARKLYGFQERQGIGMGWLFQKFLSVVSSWQLGGPNCAPDMQRQYFEE